MSGVATANDVDHRSPAPRAPITLEDTGLGASIVEQLLIKSLYGGEATGLVLADRLRLPYAIIEPIVERVRVEQLVEVRGATSSSSSCHPRSPGG